MKKTLFFLIMAALILITCDCFADGSFVGGCPMLSYLKPGDHAEVPMKTGLKMRKEPAGADMGVQAFYGKDIRILDGPVCKNNVVWLKIDFLGYQGWVMEGERGTYYLKKTNGTPTIADPSGPLYSSDGRKVGNCKYYSKLSIGSSVKVMNTHRLQMYRDPGRSPMSQQVSEGNTVKITDGPICVDGSVWWQINLNGTRGWVAEMSSSGKYYLAKQ